MMNSNSETNPFEIVEPQDFVLPEENKSNAATTPHSFLDIEHSLPTVAGVTGGVRATDEVHGYTKRKIPTSNYIGGGMFLMGLLVLGLIITFGEVSSKTKQKGSDASMLYTDSEKFGSLMNKEGNVWKDELGKLDLENLGVDIAKAVDGVEATDTVAWSEENWAAEQQAQQNAAGQPATVATATTPAPIVIVQDPVIPAITPQSDVYHETANPNRIADIGTYLVDNGISTEKNIQSTYRPQHSALQWITYQDKLKLDIPLGDVNSKEGYAFVTRYILAVVYYSLGGNFWTDQLNFLSDGKTCDWFSLVISEYGTYPRGVACDSDGVIDGLFLDSNKLETMIPDEMGLLTTLKALNLDINVISGEIPDSFSQLTALQHLTIAHNFLSGELPLQFDTLRLLESIDLSYNYIEGTLPSSISMMPKLTALAIDNNMISGTIGGTFGTKGGVGVYGGLLPIEFLYAEGNNFTDTIDDTFLTDLNKLLRLDLSGNQFKGTLPAHLFKMPMLEVLDLHDNAITGVLPPFLQTNTQLKFMALQKNQIYGTIPSLINTFTGLFHLDLSENRLTGTITENIAALQNLTYLVLAKNSFTPGPIPDFLQQVPGLKDLSLKGTNRNGPLPEFLGDLDKLVLLDLDDNQLVGPIPDSFANMKSLQFVLLNGNKLTGTIPAFFKDFKMLRLLFVDTNDFTGNGLDTMFCRNTDDTYKPYMIADCGGLIGEVQCDCCHKCCTDSDPCNDNDLVPSNDPTWQFGYNRLFYNFGDRVAFYSF